jgi:hypothetical protein
MATRGYREKYFYYYSRGLLTYFHQGYWANAPTRAILE